MDGIELGRRVARQQAGRGADAKLAASGRGQPGAAAATGVDCAAGAPDPLRQFGALRRRQVPSPMRWAARPTAKGRLAVGR